MSRAVARHHLSIRISPGTPVKKWCRDTLCGGRENKRRWENSHDLMLEVVQPLIEIWAGSKSQCSKLPGACGTDNPDQRDETVRNIHNKIRQINGTGLVYEVVVH